MSDRRNLLFAMAAGFFLSVSTAQPVHSQPYPSRPITVIVPFGAGGATDVIMRTVGEQMGRILGRPIVIENVPGAGGAVGAMRAMRAPPDGYTILLGHIGTHAVAPATKSDLGYKPDVDFEAIGLVLEAPLLLTTRKEFPPENLRTFGAHVKANEDKMNVAHPGVGSNGYNYCLLLNSLLGVKPTMVPFNSSATAINALISGQVDYVCTGLSDSRAHLESGMLKAYAIGSAERHPLLPEIPTSREAGLPEWHAVPWWALFTSKGTPQEVVAVLSSALDKALDDAVIRERLTGQGSTLPTKERRGSEPLRGLVKSDLARWRTILN